LNYQLNLLIRKNMLLFINVVGRREKTTTRKSFEEKINNPAITDR